LYDLFANGLGLMVETFHPSLIQTVGIEYKEHFDVLNHIISIVLLNPVTKSDTVHPPILRTLVWRTPSYIQYNIQDYQRGKEVSCVTHNLSFLITIRLL